MNTRQFFEITYRDKFDNKKVYKRLDIIKFMGEFYVCIKDGTVGTSLLNLECFHKLEFFDEQEPKTGQFAKWVAREIFDEDWEYNKDAFAELACRKLAKLGIVRAKGDEWKLIDLQESEEV